jgi:hypothetical protein
LPAHVNYAFLLLLSAPAIKGATIAGSGRGQ